MSSHEYTVQCVKLGALLPGLDKPPFSSPLGQRIYGSVSKQAWDLWQEESRTIMNHYGLSMADPESRKKLRDAMVVFLFGAEEQK